MSTPSSAPYISPELQEYIEYLQSEILALPIDTLWAPLISDTSQILAAPNLYRRYVAAVAARARTPSSANLSTVASQDLKLLFLSFLATAPADFFIHFLSENSSTSALTPWISDSEHYRP